MENIEKIEAGLWEAADDLRSNGNVPSNEYFMPVMGILFLRHAANRFKAATEAIEADQTAGRMPKRKIVEADYKKRRALMLPENARFEYLQNLPAGTSVGKALVEAMEAVETKVESLTGLLPKDYEKFDNDLLDNLLRVFDREEMRCATGDVFGRIYEYFLMKFSMSKAHDDGEFFTPPSIVQTLINVIEPDHGKILDPACGSGGMFVQSSHFIENQGQDTAHKVTFYGQEKTGTTVRLAKMNLAVHGLEGDIRESNSYYEDAHELVDQSDFVMANPPFNVDMIDAEKIKTDIRLPFGLPGVNKAKKVSNGNYVWISYFYSYLKEGGRAGFVMSSQASSAGNTEAEVRKKLVETGHVDAMIAIRSNFFYTRTVPCELWFFDKGKPEERRDTVLMLDARKVYRKVTRKIYDFSPEQTRNLTAISWLFRGQTERFDALLGEYADNWRAARCALDSALPDAMAHWEAFIATCKTAALNLPEDAKGKADASEAAKALVAQLEPLNEETGKLPELHAQRDHESAETRKQYPKDVAAFHKQLQHYRREADAAYRALKAGIEKKEKKAFEQCYRAANAAVDSIDSQAKEAAYWCKQIEWLRSRFPEGVFTDVPGLCKAVSLAEIEAADWSLTPGRYVGVAPEEEDDDFDFEATMKEIHGELAELNTEAARLAKKIQKNFEELAL